VRDVEPRRLWKNRDRLEFPNTGNSCQLTWADHAPKAMKNGDSPRCPHGEDHALGQRRLSPRFSRESRALGGPDE